ncbi:MAG: hypothetical protein ACFFC7_01320 [Candidatus Hermodarchaeota archaeon]
MDHFEYEEDVERSKKTRRPKKAKDREGKPSYRGRKPRSKYQRTPKKSKRATELISEEFFDDIYDEEADSEDN